MEDKAGYAAGQIETPVICPDCNSQLGIVLEAGKRVWLVIGGLRLSAAHGQCACGAPLHWTSGEVKLLRLLEKSKKKRSA